MHLVQTLEVAPCPAGDDNILINSQQVLNSCFRWVKTIVC